MARRTGKHFFVVVCCRAWCCVHVCVGSTNFPDQIPLQFWPTIRRRSEYFFAVWTCISECFCWFYKNNLRNDGVRRRSRSVVRLRLAQHLLRVHMVQAILVDFSHPLEIHWQNMFWLMVSFFIKYLHLYLGKISILTHIFQRGWFNHQRWCCDWLDWHGPCFR